MRHHTPEYDDERTIIDPPPASATTLGGYVVGNKLGQGAFGTVFAGHDPDLDRDVAIKVLHQEHGMNPEILRRFLQEGRSTARINHPGIVTIHDCGIDGDTAYIAMELLAGESLTARLARCGRLSPDAAMEFCRQMAAALDAAHRAGVIHRDLKPDNIYLVPDPAAPAGERVKILDFGLAKHGASHRTSIGTTFGTPRYMSPEQCRSAANTDARSDIYALGCILFELLTGRPPFSGGIRELVTQHLGVTAPRAYLFLHHISAELDDLLARMLEKDPARRPQTMSEVQRGLELAGARTTGAAITLPPMAAASLTMATPAPTLAQLPAAYAAPRAIAHERTDKVHKVAPPALARRRPVVWLLVAAAVILGVVLASRTMPQGPAEEPTLALGASPS